MDTYFYVSCRGVDEETGLGYYWAEWNNKDGMYLQDEHNSKEYYFDRGECSISEFCRHFNTEKRFDDDLGAALGKVLTEGRDEFDAIFFAFLASLDKRGMVETREACLNLLGIKKTYYYDMLSGKAPDERARRLMLAWLRTAPSDRARVFNCAC